MGVESAEEGGGRTGFLPKPDTDVSGLFSPLKTLLFLFV